MTITKPNNTEILPKRSRHCLQRIMLVLTVVASFMFVTPFCAAQVGDFTIYPTYQHGNNVHWLVRSATPGERVVDFVTVENLKDEEQVIDLKVIEAYEENNSFVLEENKPAQNIGVWTHLAEQQITLKPYEKKRVTVTIHVPENTKIGRYTGSVLAAKSVKNDQNQTIVTRLGTRIYLQVQRSYLRANIFTAPYANNLLLILGVAGVATMAFVQYKKRTLVVVVGLITAGSMMTTMNVQAQQLLVQVIGGGYRLSGPSEIVFDPVTASFDESTSEVTIRDLVDGYVLVEDQNGGSEFEVQIQTSGPLTNTTDPSATIPLTNFLVKNVSGSGNNIDTLNGRSDGLTLNSLLNDFYQDPPTNSIANDLGTTRVLATGSGQQPGQWKFYPGFKLIIPEATPIGVYETTLVFTII